MTRLGPDNRKWKWEVLIREKIIPKGELREELIKGSKTEHQPTIHTILEDETLYRVASVF